MSVSLNYVIIWRTSSHVYSKWIVFFFDKLKNFIKYSKGWNLRYNLTKKERIINNIEKKP